MMKFKDSSLSLAYITTIFLTEMHLPLPPNSELVEDLWQYYEKNIPFPVEKNVRIWYSRILLPVSLDPTRFCIMYILLKAKILAKERLDRVMRTVSSFSSVLASNTECNNGNII